MLTNITWEKNNDKAETLNTLRLSSRWQGRAARPAPIRSMILRCMGDIRSGILANSDGNRADSVGLMPDGKWRLGNEEDTKDRTDPDRDADGGQRRGGESAGQPHSPVGIAPPTGTVEDDDGHDVQFREGFAELSNLDFAPEMTFWAGKRYSSSNTSSHQFDWEYIRYNGTGGGFDNMDLGFARFDAGVYAFSPTDETKAYPVDKGDQGYPDDYSLNLWLL